jgi:hypothetical protein
VNTTDVLAIIGAVTGIIGTIAGLAALGWDYYKWRYAERVQLRVWATPGFATTDNPNENLISISVTNIGKISTTIKLISLHGFDSKRELKKRNGQEPSVVLNPLYATAPFPARLEPGNEWSGAINQDQEGIRKYLKYKYFILQIEDALSEKPFRAEIDKSRIERTPNKLKASN